MLYIPSFSKRLAKSSNFTMSLFAASMAFLTYSSMYAFRKPFAAAPFEGELVWGTDLKIWLILAQTIGYMASKFYGVKMISELNLSKMLILILGLIGSSWMGLLFFALLPAPFNILGFLINGFPLGLIWGLVFSYLEGRKFTEMMGSMLAVSFVFSSGMVKSVGKYLLGNWNISELWMPFFAGGVFVPLLIIAVLLLNQTPIPSEEDIALRSNRTPMPLLERKNFFRTFQPGIIVLIVVYMVLTALRDIRDNFAVEIWAAMKIDVPPELLTKTEIPTTLVLLILMALLVLINNNRKALFLYHWIIIAGLGLAIGSTLMHQIGLISPFWWVVSTGTGIYMGYIPFNCLLFDRLIAAFKSAGNVGFLMYLADSFGYLGSLGIVVIKQFSILETISWYNFYILGILIVLSISILLILFSRYYFEKKLKKQSFSMATGKLLLSPHSINQI
jgi:MFS family permease